MSIAGQDECSSMRPGSGKSNGFLGWRATGAGCGRLALKVRRYGSRTITIETAGPRRTLSIKWRWETLSTEESGRRGTLWFRRSLRPDRPAGVCGPLPRGSRDRPLPVTEKQSKTSNPRGSLRGFFCRPARLLPYPGGTSVPAPRAETVAAGRPLSAGDECHDDRRRTPRRPWSRGSSAGVDRLGALPGVPRSCRRPARCRAD